MNGNDLLSLSKRGDVQMTYEWIVFFSVFLAFICALCILILLISHTTQSMLYDFKKEFRRIRDGEQYEMRQVQKKV